VRRGHSRFLIALIGVALLGGGTPVGAHPAKADARLSRIGPAPDFALTLQDGTQIGLADLRSKVVVVTFIYTTCADTCPLLTAKLVGIQRQLGTDGVRVRFVAITVDPEKDTPEVLRSYAERLQAEPGRWDFLTGPKPAIYKLSHDGFKLAVSDGSDAQGIPVHSTRMALVDRHGQIRGYYDATEADAITKLVADTTHLLREQPK